MMPSYIGFSTLNSNKPKTTDAAVGVAGGVGTLRAPIIFGKKFKLVDESLILQDFLNALNITKGQKVGQPEYGTDLWSYVFEPGTADVQLRLENEIRRVASQDPRLILNSLIAYPQENGILIEVELAVAPFNTPRNIDIYFSNLTNKAEIR
jgi:phage baseplate assembly protein W